MNFHRLYFKKWWFCGKQKQKLCTVFCLLHFIIVSIMNESSYLTFLFYYSKSFIMSVFKLFFYSRQCPDNLQNRRDFGETNFCFHIHLCSMTIVSTKQLVIANMTGREGSFVNSNEVVHTKGLKLGNVWWRGGEIPHAVCRLQTLKSPCL